MLTKTIATASVTSSSPLPSSSSNTSVSSSSAAIAAKVSHATVPFTITTTPATPNSISFGPTLTETNKLPANVRDVNNNERINFQYPITFLFYGKAPLPSYVMTIAGRYVKGKGAVLICGRWMIELLSTMSSHHKTLIEEHEQPSRAGR
ncbi:hypothetical protein GQX74_013237 [Glossina fuscipes]|nr:hypothetical protein GQX74_013237 [Glossina fuscipes]